MSARDHAIRMWFGARAAKSVRARVDANDRGPILRLAPSNSASSGGSARGIKGLGTSLQWAAFKLGAIFSMLSLGRIIGLVALRGNWLPAATEYYRHQSPIRRSDSLFTMFRK